MSYIDGGSFAFGTTDMYDTYGIQLYDMIQDVLKPRLRKNSITIPHRDGVVDFGARYYDQRNLKLRCITTRALMREEIREISYTLSTKSQLRLFCEPDKYYIGQLYDADKLAIEPVSLWRFDLTFICDPFAYSEVITRQFVDRDAWTYGGTATTPTVIEIRNPNDYAISGIQINMREVIT